ncbi:serine protease HTRA2, mitochondrial-like isoform X2 [Sabethes cyaneus]|uniref:serine protease HTRA2, mitochondrial-like isoform X2 n=1 Tax=Sabethes cyaneus TaxID=53552 RepID=UPI00237E7B75|nr:serine protease HTRA2, mitochondrial-like isoform X2 [Sabethes cyaneus]
MDAKLIFLIEGREALWQNHPLSFPRWFVDQQWEEISTELGVSSSTNFFILADDAKRRWRTLRDTFTRKLKTGTHWEHEQSMAFLTRKTNHPERQELLLKKNGAKKLKRHRPKVKAVSSTTIVSSTEETAKSPSPQAVEVETVDQAPADVPAHSVPLCPRTEPNLEDRRNTNNSIADVVDACSAAVVHIECDDTLHYDIFSGQTLTVSSGSGFIVDQAGLILTNIHVVIGKPNASLTVKLPDGRKFPGAIEQVDPNCDLALVRIQCEDLPVIKLGESANLRLGEQVIALGSPLTPINTVTAGIVNSMQCSSAELGLRGKNINYIQTDAAITFANSGGPLVNLSGEAIGVNSMKLTPGMSFAIAIDHARELLQKVKERGTSTALSPCMGLTVLTLVPEILRELRQRSLDVPDNFRSGNLVWKVVQGSPAHVIGLYPGDIITGINDREMVNSADLYKILEDTNCPLKITFFRGEENLTRFVQLLQRDTASCWEQQSDA